MTALFLLLSSVLSAGATDFSDWGILKLNEAYLDFSYNNYARNPFLFPTYAPVYTTDLHINLGLVNNIVFWENMLHAQTDAGGYRLIGWNYKIGVHVGDSLDVFMEHFSQHILDYPSPGTNTFDAIGVRIWFYREKQR